jgi:hypothetical protein
MRIDNDYFYLLQKVCVCVVSRRERGGGGRRSILLGCTAIGQFYGGVLIQDFFCGCVKLLRLF